MYKFLCFILLAAAAYAGMVLFPIMRPFIDGLITIVDTTDPFMKMIVSFWPVIPIGLFAFGGYLVIKK